MKHRNETETKMQREQCPVQNSQQFLQRLKQNQRLFLPIFLFVWILTSAYTVIGYKPSYASSGLVMIKDTALTAKYVTADHYEMTTAQSTNSVMNTMALLKTTLVMEDLWLFLQSKHPEALSQLKIKTFSEWQKIYGNGGKFIRYSNLPGTDLIRLEFKWDNPQIAKEGLDVILATFKDTSLHINRTEQRERRRYLAQQIDSIQEKLNQVRLRSSEFKTQHNIVNTDEETANITKARLDVKTSLAMTNAEAAGKAHQASGYRKLLGLNTHDALQATGLGRNETLAKLQSELYSAQSEKATLLTKYTEQSVKVLEIDNHIHELQTSIQHEMSRSLGPGNRTVNIRVFSDETRSKAVGDMVNAATEAQQLNAKHYSLNNYLKTLETRAQALPKIEAILANYRLEENALNDSLKTLKEKELDAQLKESQSLSNVFIVDPPRLPIEATLPRLPHLLALDFILAFSMAIGLILLMIRIQLLYPTMGSVSALQQLWEIQFKPEESSGQVLKRSGTSSISPHNQG